MDRTLSIFHACAHNYFSTLEDDCVEVELLRDVQVVDQLLLLLAR